MDSRQMTVFAFAGKLLVDEIVGEINGGGILLGVGKEDFLHPGPVKGAQAHGTRLARTVDYAVSEPEVLELCAGIAYGQHLGMRSRVVEQCYRIGACAYHPLL